MMLLRFWRFEICFMASSSNSSRSSSRQRFRHSCTNVSLVRVGFISKICRVVMKSSWSHISHNSATTYWYFQKVLKISLWSTYFVYVRTPKTRGFPKDFQRFFFSYIFDVILIGELLTEQEMILQLTVAINFIPNDCDRTMQGPALCTLDPLHDTTTVYCYVLHPVHKHKHAYAVWNVKKSHEINQYN